MVNIGIYIWVLLLPRIVLASGDTLENIIGYGMMECFVTFIVSIMIIKPFVDKVWEEEKKLKVFIIVVMIRILIVAFLMIDNPDFVYVDFILLMFSIPFMNIIYSSISSKQKFTDFDVNYSTFNIIGVCRCRKCHAINNINNRFCVNCGKMLGNKSIDYGYMEEKKQAELAKTYVANSSESLVKYRNLKKTGAFEGKWSDFAFGKKITTIPLEACEQDHFIYSKWSYHDKNVDAILKEMISEKLKSKSIKEKITVSEVEKRKNIFTIIYTIILFICVSMLFFHVNVILIAIAGIIMTGIYLVIMKNYNIEKYIMKEIKSRPDEKIDYIVSSVIASKIKPLKYQIIRICMFIVVIIAPCIIFRVPRMIYEAQDEGYVVRFYTLGLFKKDEELIIPSEYKGKPVIGIRGDVFANVKTIKKVVLPETIREIRGGAFNNAANLEEINLPEAITEIKGDTFRDCSSLKKIIIPDNVTRIGGHAFFNDVSLEKVVISENSQLGEIGSSAFRNCDSLKEITIPEGTIVNERAFKESPTVVKRYGYYELVNSDDYQYDTYIYLKDNEQHKLIMNSLAYIQEIYLRLANVTITNGKSTFTLEYTDATGTITFDLTEDNPIKEINEDLVIFVKGDYSFNNREKVGLYIYYN